MIVMYIYITYILSPYGYYIGVYIYIRDCLDIWIYSWSGGVRSLALGSDALILPLVRILDIPL